MKRRRKKQRKGFFNKKRLTILGISVAALLVAFFVVFGMSGIFVPSDGDVDKIVEVDKATGKINVLIAGLDKSEGLTDTIMVATYDMDADTVNILSVPRDTRMYVGSRYQKINSAYSISKNGKKSGINGTIEAVTRLTGIPINYYVVFTVDAFRECIDALGGVDFDVPQNMNYDDPVQDLHIHLQKGFQHLDGDKAEQYVRFRRYPMGDIDRVAAQQTFIKALAAQKLTPEIITKLPELFKTVQENLRTNITLQDVARYALNIADLSSENITMHALPGTSNGTDYGSSYWIADMDALAVLIRDTFGYESSKITIHSADGKSASKDVKLGGKTETPKATNTPAATPAVTEKPKTTATPAATPKATKEPENTPAATVKPTKAPEVTATPAATAAPTEKPKENEFKRPAANAGE